MIDTQAAGWLVDVFQQQDRMQLQVLNLVLSCLDLYQVWPSASCTCDQHCRLAAASLSKITFSHIVNCEGEHVN